MEENRKWFELVSTFHPLFTLFKIKSFMYHVFVDLVVGSAYPGEKKQEKKKERKKKSVTFMCIKEREEKKS